MMKVYIAAHSQERARALKAAIERPGKIQVISRWIDQEPQFGLGMSLMSPEQRERTAKDDADDMQLANLLICINSPEDATPTGGKHVEFGFMLGLHKQVWLLGPRTNIFHWHPAVKQFDFYDQLNNRLAKVATFREMYSPRPDFLSYRFDPRMLSQYMGQPRTNSINWGMFHG